GDECGLVLIAAARVESLARGADLALDLLPALVPEDAIGLQLAGLFFEGLGAGLQFMPPALPFVQSPRGVQRGCRPGARGRSRDAERDRNVEVDRADGHDVAVTQVRL